MDNLPKKTCVFCGETENLRQMYSSYCDVQEYVCEECFMSEDMSFDDLPEANQ